MPKTPCLWHEGRQDPGELPAAHNAAGAANSRAYPSPAALGIPPEAPAQGLAELGGSLRADLFPQPHGITPATSSWGDIRSRCILSCLTLLQTALFFGMTPWFRSLELAGRWNTHSPGDKGRQHLEAIIPALLYLSPTPFVRNHSQYQQSLCHKPGKGFFSLSSTRQWRLSRWSAGWARLLLPGHRRTGHSRERHL